jgi:ABC-2 type transport system ATP-binding protein
MTPVLEFAGVSRSYTKGVPVLSEVSFQVGEGEVVGLLGRNGAGKTTLIHIAMGLLSPDSGAVRVFGISPVERPIEVKRRVGFVSEEQVLPPGASVAELISFHRYLFASWDEALERSLLERFALPPRQKIKRLSKGQARQVALLCAVCHRPKLLILDEPAGGLDPAARREFLETSIQLLNREGTTILFSSHQMNDVERIGGRVIVLGGGCVRLDRDLDWVREQISVAIVPRASALEASAVERVPGCLRLRQVGEEWHAVMEGTPEAARARLIESLRMNGISCQRVSLEELFIELLGGER